MEATVNELKVTLPAPLARAVKTNTGDWQSGGKGKRLWQCDASLWTGSDEAQWLGWLDIVEEQVAQQDQLQKIAKEVQQRGFEHVLLLGMGGSSLCPDVLRMTFRRIKQFPALHVLDSTDPAQVKSFEHQIDIPKTLFIVSGQQSAGRTDDVAGDRSQSLVGFLKRPRGLFLENPPSRKTQ
jgi:transaldolase / glucose-6-phosphate isomerase